MIEVERVGTWGQSKVYENSRFCEDYGFAETGNTPTSEDIPQTFSLLFHSSFVPYDSFSLFRE